MADAHNETTSSVAGLFHEVQGYIARELDETVVAGLRDNEYILDIRADACAAWRMHERASVSGEDSRHLSAIAD